MRLALLLACGALLTGCASNGWDADPVGDTKDKATCYQVTQWASNGWTKYSEAVGTYCPSGPVNIPTWDADHMP